MLKPTNIPFKLHLKATKSAYCLIKFKQKIILDESAIRTCIDRDVPVVLRVYPLQEQLEEDRDEVGERHHAAPCRA